MREILFRGKSANPKEWHCGFYLILNNYLYIIPDDVKITPDGIEMYQVDPKTVGQYTGFVDKNGERIFEGDIVCMDNWTPQHMQIAYAQGAFYLAEIEKSVKYFGDIYYVIHGGKPQEKVVGNIYDNPELLEGVINNG